MRYDELAELIAILAFGGMTVGLTILWLVVHG